MSNDNILKAILEADVRAYLHQESDFAFEMQTLQVVTGEGFVCRHGGTYRDPITDKARQFDIRASLVEGKNRLLLAVESKNLRATSPLLVHTIARTSSEALTEVILRRRDVIVQTHPQRISEANSLYREGEQVGKTADQVSRKKNGDFGRSDGPVFEKVSQAVSSSHELVRETVSSAPVPSMSLIVPILVVPDGRLWVVEYGPDGAIRRGPAAEDSISMFLDQGWTVPGQFGPVTYTMSHLEIVCLAALAAKLRELRASMDGLRKGAELFNLPGM